MADSIAQTYYFRPVTSGDVDALTTMVKQSTGGLSSLQPRRDFLADYVAVSEASFSGQKDVETPHKYLLGLFDGDKLVGCSAVKTQTGVDTPFINFDIVGEGIEQLLVASDRFKGATEVGSLFLHPDYRMTGLGRYLAKVRYMLMASEPWRFGDTVIAELRGICGADGSPLYDYLFEDKLEKSFLEADTEYFDRNPLTLGDIVPIGKISLKDFPIDVRASIGQPHPSGIGAMRLLQKEGFIFSGTIDLFDAGPIVHAYRDTIRTIRNRKSKEISRIAYIKNGVPALLSVGKVADFHACVTDVKIENGHIQIPSEAARLLSLDVGDNVYIWSEALERDLLKETNANKLVKIDM